MGFALLPILWLFNVLQFSQLYADKWLPAAMH